MNCQLPFMPISQFESKEINEFLELSEQDLINDNDLIVKSTPKSEFEDGDRYSKNIEFILESMGMEKYVNLFRSEDIGINILFSLDSDDFLKLGITDPTDRLQLLENLNEFCSSEKNMNVIRSRQYDPTEDLIMCTNVFNHLLQLNSFKVQFYKKLKHTMSNEPNSVKYFLYLDIIKSGYEKAILQCDRISDVLFGGSSSGDNLINSILKCHDLILPHYIKRKLLKYDKIIKLISSKKTFRKRQVVLSTTALLGLIFAGISIHRNAFVLNSLKNSIFHTTNVVSDFLLKFRT